MVPNTSSEAFDRPRAAIRCQMSLKRWPREWKVNSIGRKNPDWLDLYDALNR